MRTLNCPRCEQPMKCQTVATPNTAVVIDVCATYCGGIWLDDSDMQTGLDVSDDLQVIEYTPCATPDCGQPTACPICGQTMQRYRWNYTSPVTLDQCPAGHGTWIDAGEVQAMEQFEEQEVLAADKKVQLQARLGMERLELEANHLRHVARGRNQILNMIELIWSRYS